MIKNLLILVFIILTNSTSANERAEIIKNIQEINSLYFDFKQINNDIIETGYCNIIYPLKAAHCVYDGVDQKEIFIINNNLSIIEKDGKKSLYNINNSQFQILLNKDDIINILNQSEKFEMNEKNIIIKSNDNQNNIFEIYFDKKNLLISGWKIQNYDKTYLQFILDKVKINVDNKNKFIKPN